MHRGEPALRLGMPGALKEQGFHDIARPLRPLPERTSQVRLCILQIIVPISYSPRTTTAVFGFGACRSEKC